MRINTIRLRLMIGWLGMLLPWIVSALIWQIPESISATWYTNASTVFMIILGSASLLLISYKGYETIDDILLTSAGILGLCICIFPCYNLECDLTNTPVGTFQLPVNISATIHNVSAICFFALLSINSIFLFTKTGDKENLTLKKKIRNYIYIACGIGMIASFALLFFCSVWLVETFALFFFGISFLTKANKYSWLSAD